MLGYGVNSSGGLYPQYGDCLGVCIIGEVLVRYRGWQHYSFETISKEEFETLLAFGFYELDIINTSPEDYSYS